MSYFAHLASCNQPKNALQRAAADLLEKLSRRVVPGTASGFIDALGEEIEKLNAVHFRCTPLMVHDWPTGSGWGIGLGDQFTVGFYLYEIKEDDSDA